MGESMFNMDAPNLNPRVQQAFAEDPALQESLRLNFVRFLKFLGLAWKLGEDGREPEVQLADNFGDRVEDCWTSMWGGNHNWLRISRVLMCLGRCGLFSGQKSFHDCRSCTGTTTFLASRHFHIGETGPRRGQSRLRCVLRQQTRTRNTATIERWATDSGHLSWWL